MANSFPTIALCIPAYKAEEHLPRLLDSALQQDPPFDEIIVCVDASPDETANVAKAFGVTVIVNETNLGCSASKNRALEDATADWVHFHDADDILLPGFTREAHHWMGLQTPPDVVIMGYEYLDYLTRDHLGTGLQSDEQLSSDPVAYAIRNKLPNFGIYQRRKISDLGGFDLDPATLYNEDVAFHLKLALAGLSFRASSQITSINYRHGNSMSSENAARCEWAHCEVMRRTAAITGDRYSEEIAARFWAAATRLATISDWVAMDRALKDATHLRKGVPPNQSRVFEFLCRLLGPRVAFRIREHTIRMLKPQMRSPT